MFNKIIIFLISIAIIARFIGLNSIPSHLSNDEIGAAYDAYSISKTLRDEHDQLLPITFLSHGIYRSALAVYLTVPGIMIFGNSDFGARLPSAILGSLTVILLGLLVLELTNNKRLALLASLMLAFSPWHFSVSRWTMESNYALFFVVLGIYLFFYGLIRNKIWATIGSATAFALSLYAYYTEWGLIPLIIFSLFYFYRKNICQRKSYLVAISLLVLLLIPLIFDFMSHTGASRASTEFIYKDISVTRLIEKNNFNSIQKGQIILKAFADKYFLYVSPGYIFFYGSNILSSSYPYQVGLFLPPILICFILGLVKLKNHFKEHSGFIYFWLLLTPIIPSLTLGALSNVRILSIVAPVAIISAVGLLYVLEYIGKGRFLLLLSIALTAVSLLYFLLIYVFYFPVEQAEGFQYGFKQIAFYIKEHYTEYDKIIIDPRFGKKEFYFYGVPHVYIPFYTQMNPIKLQQAQKLTQGLAFDKYETRFINWDQEKIQKRYLYIVPADNIPIADLLKKLTKISEIQLPNHKVQFNLYTTSASF